MNRTNPCAWAFERLALLVPMLTRAEAHELCEHLEALAAELRPAYEAAIDRALDRAASEDLDDDLPF